MGYNYTFIHLIQTTMLQLQVIGNLTADSEVKTMNGVNVITFSVACNRKVAGREFTDYIDCTLNQERAAIFPYLLKGKKVYVQGLPRMRAYINRDGKPMAGLSLMIDRLELLSSAHEEKPTSFTREAEQDPLGPAAANAPY